MTNLNKNATIPANVRVYSESDVLEIRMIDRSLPGMLAGYRPCLVNPNIRVTKGAAFKIFIEPVNTILGKMEAYPEFYLQEIEYFRGLISGLETFVDENPERFDPEAMRIDIDSQAIKRAKENT